MNENTTLVLATALTLAFGATANAQVPGYVQVEGAFINGSAIGSTRTGTSLAACAAACNAESRCLSFEMYGQDSCSLNAANRSTRPNILSRSSRYTYYEKTTAQPTNTQSFIYQNCSEGLDRCTLGVADGAYSTPGNPRYREGWRRLVDEGPFADHPAAWRRVCRLHAPPARIAPAIVAGEIDCEALGAPSRVSSMSAMSSGANGAPAGYVVVEGAFINGSAIGRSRPGHTAESCAALCSAEPRCLSFELYQGAQCSLNAANRSTRANILSRSGRYRYFEKMASP